MEKEKSILELTTEIAFTNAEIDIRKQAQSNLDAISKRLDDLRKEVALVYQVESK